MKLTHFILTISLLIVGLNILAQATVRNPWGMNQQQYDLFENTSVSAINALPGTHPTYGALSLPEVSYISNTQDNGSSPMGQFRFKAAPSHYLKDDPIVFPNQPGASYLHMFFWEYPSRRLQRSENR